MRWFLLCVVFGGTHLLAQEALVQHAAPDSHTEGPAGFLAAYNAQAIERWDSEIRKLEQRDAVEADPADAILFIGSSSIRRWDDIAIDMAPYRTIQRGYGGAKYSDLAVFADRLIRPHQYRALVMFVGNDVSGKPDDHGPEEVERLVRYIVGVSQRHRSEAPVLIVEVTPTEKRFAAWPQIRALNARLREVALSTPGAHFVATAEQILDSNGRPRTELFVDDQLHLNRDGYDLWSQLIRRRLDQVLRAAEASRSKSSAAAEPLAD